MLNRKTFKLILYFTIIILICYTVFTACIFELPRIDYNKGTLEYIIENIRIEYKLPAIMVSIANNDDEPVIVATGYRNYRNPDFLVSKSDKWHIGSITKSITSTLIAKLIETDSRLKWDLSIKEVFPELSNEILPDYKDITFTQLLSHTAGIITDIRKVPDWDNYFYDTNDIKSQRYRITKDILKMSAAGPAGYYAYSNAGYVVAGAMIEKILVKSWEELIKNYIFNNLEMNETGFGVPSPKDSQPLGHIEKQGYYIWKPFYPEDKYADNPKVLGPAGTLHTTAMDIMKFAGLHLDGLKKISTFLTNESFNKLHSVVADSYSMGWIVQDKAIWHNGSNTKWYALLYIYYDEKINQSKRIFIVFNAFYNDLNKNNEIINKIFAEITK